MRFFFSIDMGGILMEGQKHGNCSIFFENGVTAPVYFGPIF